MMNETNQPQTTEITEQSVQNNSTDRFSRAMTMAIASVSIILLLTFYIMGVDNNIIMEPFNVFSKGTMINSYILGYGTLPLLEAFKASMVLVALPFFLIALFSFLGVFLTGVFLFVIATVGLSLLLPSMVLLAPISLMVLAYIIYKRKKSSSQSPV